MLQAFNHNLVVDGLKHHFFLFLIYVINTVIQHQQALCEKVMS